MKFIPVYLNLSLVLGVLISINQTIAPSLAQTATQSDSSGTILSTGDFAGQTLPSTTIPLTTIATDSVNSSLTLNELTTPTGSSISASAQQAILNILTQGDQSNTSISSVTDALSAASGAPPLSIIQDLLSSLEGLTKNKKLLSAKLLVAIQAYNATILASKEEFLGKPPVELVAIQAALIQLVKEATA